MGGRCGCVERLERGARGVARGACQEEEHMWRCTAAECLLQALHTRLLVWWEHAHKPRSDKPQTTAMQHTHLRHEAGCVHEDHYVQQSQLPWLQLSSSSHCVLRRVLREGLHPSCARDRVCCAMSRGWGWCCLWQCGVSFLVGR